VSTNRLFTAALVGWLLLVVAALVGRTAFGTGLSAPEYGAWIFAGCAPLAILLIIRRGRSTGSMTQVLYDVEHAGEEVIRRSGRPAGPLANQTILDKSASTDARQRPE
jgi:hypothetical protein